MEFRELFDEEWAFIEPLLTTRDKTSRLRVDDRMVF